MLNFQLLRHEGYFAASPDSAPLLHYWSLSVEEQYYLLFPLFLLGALRIRQPLLPIVAVGVTSLALAFLLTPPAPSFAFYSLPTRAWEFVAGASVALVPALRRDAPCPLRR